MENRGGKKISTFDDKLEPENRSIQINSNLVLRRDNFLSTLNCSVQFNLMMALAFEYLRLPPQISLFSTTFRVINNARKFLSSSVTSRRNTRDA